MKWGKLHGSLGKRVLILHREWGKETATCTFEKESGDDFYTRCSGEANIPIYICGSKF